MALHDEEPLVARLAVWLAAQGVQCHESVITTRDGVVAGYGCVATRKLKKGELLFRVPRKACFGPRAGAPIDAEAPGDTQRRFAVRLLKERALGSASRWHPLLAVLSPAPCPWIWPEGSERFLDGTELEEVLARKRQRLRCERKKIGLSDDAARSREYDAACALVASHLNPWFGGSITPVNATLNYAAAPNVEFEAEGVDTVVARAVRPIAAGEELTQEYCESTAMFLYRQEAQALEQLAGSEGGEDGDPWPALLAQAAALAPVGRRAQIEESITNAIERARHAVRQRHSRLEAATVAPPEERSDGYAASGDAQYGAGRAGKRTAKRARLSAEAGSAEHRPSVPAAETAAISLAGAWRLAQGLRRVEQAILEDALRLLEAASAEKLAVKLG
ncbi:n-lysine methyltransferase setd6 [Chrysochromulina tobinii]|uniref:N-lysine methyltransferase setd6 n=1 Tax=Chrysochromulina tobinii TaxID=1460289 RepID=A0A0M0LQT2_9EUKA|nr:n-lysine methyltransferase setd6 [Chrysochromulina tobinii]|eukprot:KOO53415.1 n-lysine methyltransferase setd6 [Chrysochromulina sp. CCMP291]